MQQRDYKYLYKKYKSKYLESNPEINNKLIERQANKDELERLRKLVEEKKG